MRKSNQQSLKEVINDLLKAYKLEVPLQEAKLVNSWEKVMGKMIARHTKEIYINKQKLFLKLDSAPLREELSYAKSKIITMLNAEAGQEVINDIVFQ